MKKKGTRCLHQETKPLITPSLHLSFFQDHNIHFHLSRCCAVCFALQTTKQTNKQNKDVGMGVMSGFVSWCRHLVPFFFMKWHSYMGRCKTWTLDRWTGPLDWTDGLDQWTGVLQYSTMPWTNSPKTSLKGACWLCSVAGSVAGRIPRL